MAYFDCIVGGSGKGNTLVVTCADDLAGATITCTNGTKTYTKTCPSTAPYEVTFYGLMAGTWTVSTTVDGNTYTTTVVITDYEAELGGFNWKTWVDLSKNYTSSDFTDLDELLDTELAVRELMTIHACVDYLAGIAAISADVEKIIENDYCAKWINNRDYALDTLYANEIIAGYMDTADKYGYGEWALVGQVPKMTSNTAPYGEVSVSSTLGGGTPPYTSYYAFNRDGNASKWYCQSSTTPEWIQYKFVNPTCIKRFYCWFDWARPVKLQASNTGNTDDWTDLTELLNPTNGEKMTQDLNNDTFYLYYRLYTPNSYYSYADYMGICELQFYAWAPKGNVPVMTSNTAPYGTAFGSREGNNAYYYMAFDGNDATQWSAGANYTTNQYVGYKSVNPVRVTMVSIIPSNDNATAYNRVKNFKVQGSNTGDTNDWHDIYTGICQNTTTAIPQVFKFDNDDYYLQYRVYVIDSYSSTTIAILSLQFYGRELSVSVPKMDTNTTPYGEASADSETASGQEAYRAFSQVSGDFWISSSTQEYNRYLEYAFVSPNVVKHIHLNIGTRSGATILTPLKFHFEAYDGSEWVSITEVTTHNTNNDTAYDFDVEQSVNAQKIRYVVDQNLVNNNSRGNHIGCAVYSDTQFYGLDYSEKEFEVGTTKKWLYDHGVELEEIGVYTQSGTVEKNSNSLYVQGNSGNYNCEVHTNNAIDLTSYSLFRAKIDKALREFILRIGNAIPINYGEGSKIVASKAYSIPLTENPNNPSLDISSVNGFNYPTVASGSNGYVEVTELWLE